MDQTVSNIRKNPSREQCEQVIRRILITELLENGSNSHFKNASDFLAYFESLYPASAALTKQIQRAVKSMDLPKDENGYFIINKTHKQLDEEHAIQNLLALSHAKQVFLEDLTPVFLKTDDAYKEALMDLISHSISFDNKYEVLLPAHNGLLFYTNTPEDLNKVLTDLFSKIK
ncbi:hypothetical protein [Eubacterium oxidoreducens]|uniref:Uncharacterized protein n=1 Tax=Eubacterium oxidoreducens TaxID=1732 RepID=A0A1G6A0V1_EUBOX|nr:hypothetical protein [Eubacterium oxidoreducens]SDB01633.1 hypothetical protein SAMN02910417_00013 [Eubacterium oxidoreducens]